MGQFCRREAVVGKAPRWAVQVDITLKFAGYNEPYLGRTPRGLQFACPTLRFR